MGFSKPSVSVAMKNMREDGLITIDEYNHIHLTDKGRRGQNQSLNGTGSLRSFLRSSEVSSEVAEEDACRIEHVISGRDL